MGEWSIRREIVIDAPIDVVWEFVATPEQTSRWWCAGLPVELVFEQREGSRFEEHYDDGELAYDIEGTVWVFKPAERLAIRRVTEGSAAPADLVDITLSKKDAAINRQILWLAALCWQPLIAGQCQLFRETWAVTVATAVLKTRAIPPYATAVGLSQQP
jgi:uncharacterized protein YndB with AHSA1/START domain